MELKPIKEKSEALYPTIKEVKKYKLGKEMLFAGQIYTGELEAVAIPSYIVFIRGCEFIRGVSILTAVLSLILLFINKIKIKRCKNEMKETLKKLKKHRKIELWILGISIAIFVITSLIVFLCSRTSM